MFVSVSIQSCPKKREKW